MNGATAKDTKQLGHENCELSPTVIKAFTWHQSRELFIFDSLRTVPPLPCHIYHAALDIFHVVSWIMSNLKSFYLFLVTLSTVSVLARISFPLPDDNNLGVVLHYFPSRTVLKSGSLVMSNWWLMTVIPLALAFGWENVSSLQCTRLLPIHQSMLPFSICC